MPSPGESRRAGAGLFFEPSEPRGTFIHFRFPARLPISNTGRSMKVGLIGHRGAGKTTIFNMLTGLHAEVGGFAGKEEIHLGVIKVPDPRIDRLSQIFKPKKTRSEERRVGKECRSRW